MTALDTKALLEGTTPGPWSVHERIGFDIVSATEHIARATINGTMEAEDRCYANARLIAEAPRLARRVIELEDENGALREIISRCASSLNSGAFISPEATVDFMWHLPKEIELRIAALKGEGDA